MGFAEDLPPGHPRIGQPETLAAPPPVAGAHADLRQGGIRPLGLDQVVEVHRSGEPERYPARDRTAKLRVVQPRLAPERVPGEQGLEELESRFVRDVAGNGEPGARGFSPARQLRDASAGFLRDGRPLLLSDGLDVLDLLVEELGPQAGRRELGVRLPREISEEAGLDRGPFPRDPRDFLGGDLGPHRAAQQEVAAEAEENRLRRRRRGLRPPLPLDPEEAGDEPRDRPGGLDQEPGLRDRVERLGARPPERQPGRERGIVRFELGPEDPVQVGEPPFAVEVLVREAGDAERKVPPGEHWRVGCALQGGGFYREPRTVSKKPRPVSGRAPNTAVRRWRLPREVPPSRSSGSPRIRRRGQGRTPARGSSQRH